MFSPGPATPRTFSSSGSPHVYTKQEAETETGKWLRTNWTEEPDDLVKPEKHELALQVFYFPSSTKSDAKIYSMNHLGAKQFQLKS